MILFNSKRIHSQIIFVNNALPIGLVHLQMKKRVNLIRDLGKNQLLSYLYIYCNDCPIHDHSPRSFYTSICKFFQLRLSSCNFRIDLSHRHYFYIQKFWLLVANLLYQEFHSSPSSEEKPVSRKIIPRNSKQNILELLTKMSNANLILIELRNFASHSIMKPSFILQVHHGLSYSLCHNDLQIQFRFKSNWIGLIHLFHIIF